MLSSINIPYYLSAAALFILLKCFYFLADVNDLKFLLKPTDKLVGILTGSQSIYIADSGYFHEYLNIIINKSCSGFNFWILSFLLFSYLMLKHFEKTFQKILTLPTSLFLAYMLTIFVNTSRIFASIVVQTQAKKYLPAMPHLLLHEAIGICTYLTFLILTYVIIDKLLTHKRYNAKFA